MPRSEGAFLPDQAILVQDQTHLVGERTGLKARGDDWIGECQQARAQKKDGENDGFHERDFKNAHRLKESPLPDKSAPVHHKLRGQR